MPEPSQREEAIFEAALALRAEQRQTYLARACGEDSQLRDRMEALLKAHVQTTGILEAETAHSSASTIVLNLPLTEKPGDRIGRYKLLQKIGEGGCGVVYMAEQLEPVKRQVALKVIKPGMDTRQVLARFEAERQALALMNHPNIAKVLDAGATDTGRPYFVMELVRGVRITDYCDDPQNNLPTQKRLELFIQVCSAIQHAHQKGIIHRDIKPSNILVTLQENGSPMPKVIDFGIAKATAGQTLTDKTLFTAFEQFIGTPAYMSPEQAQLTTIDIDTRSDIYSLGVLLYELLVGRTPFDVERLLQAGLDEIRRVIREEEPPRPSTRLSKLEVTEQTTVAKQRQSDSARLTHLLRGDLDWIVMKCLEKDRTRRYETANGLAADIQRHLDNEPVVARPPSKLYEFQKTVRRHKFGFAAAGAVAAALAIGMAISTWLFVQERAAHRRAVIAELEQLRLRGEAETARQEAQADEKKARTEAAKSQQVAQFLKEMLQSVGPSVAMGRDTTMLREIVDNTAKRVDQDLKDQPEVQIELRMTLTDAYYEMGLWEQMEEMARGTIELARSKFGDENLAVADALVLLGHALQHEYKTDESLTVNRRALEMERKLRGPDSLQEAAALYQLGYTFQECGRLDDAEAPARASLIIRRKRLGQHKDVARSLDNLAATLIYRDRLSEAEPLVREALAMRRKLYGAGHPELSRSLTKLVELLTRQGKYAEAEQLFEEFLPAVEKILGSEHPRIAECYGSLIDLLRRQNKTAELERVLRERLAILKKGHADDTMESADLLLDLAQLLQSKGERAESRPMIEQALAIYHRYSARGAGWRWNQIYELLVVSLSGSGNTGALESTAKQIVEDLRAARPDDPRFPVALAYYSEILRQNGKITEARPPAEEAVAICRRHPEVFEQWIQDRASAALKEVQKALGERVSR